MPLSKSSKSMVQEIVDGIVSSIPEEWIAILDEKTGYSTLVVDLQVNIGDESILCRGNSSIAFRMNKKIIGNTFRAKGIFFDIKNDKRLFLVEKIMRV